MATLGQDVKILTPMTHCAADKLFAVAIAGSSVDEIESGVEASLEQFGGLRERNLAIADFRSAEAQSADHHLGPTQTAALKAVITRHSLLHETAAQADRSS